MSVIAVLRVIRVLRRERGAYAGGGAGGRGGGVEGRVDSGGGAGAELGSDAGGRGGRGTAARRGGLGGVLGLGDDRAGQATGHYTGDGGDADEHAGAAPDVALDLVEEGARVALVEPVGDSGSTRGGLVGDIAGYTLSIGLIGHRTQLVAQGTETGGDPLLLCGRLVGEFALRLAIEVLGLLLGLAADLVQLVLGDAGDVLASGDRGVLHLGGAFFGIGAGSAVGRRAGVQVGVSRDGCWVCIRHDSPR
ncbi:hypothetical protein E3O60_03765 [Cryobacterium sp. TMB1-7]|nr:hypothetical protein E3O60_03765 [Cryobacterium sp. TMB1-7]